MEIIFEHSTIVVVARDVNLSIFKPLWLMKNAILREDELSGNVVITPPLVQISTDKFALTILPDRLQLSIPKLYGDANNDIQRIVVGITKTLPHTPYMGVGLNFNYLLTPSNQEQFISWNRKLFASSLAEKIQTPANNNARFGSYLSFDTLESRLKIDIKPVKAIQPGLQSGEQGKTEKDFVRLNFNYHKDVAGTVSPSDSIATSIEKWPAALKYADQLIQLITE